MLIGDSVRRCLTLVEAKANLPAFTAYDVVEKAQGLTDNDPSKRGDLDKHLQRLAWAERNLEGLVRRWGLGPSDGWRVQGRWVTKEPVASAFLGEELRVEMTPFRELREGDLRDWLSPDS